MRIMPSGQFRSGPCSPVGRFTRSGQRAPTAGWRGPQQIVVSARRLAPFGLTRPHRGPITNQDTPKRRDNSAHDKLYKQLIGR
jgi:hypothetical protein